jgi:hypothetical protein
VIDPKLNELLLPLMRNSRYPVFVFDDEGNVVAGIEVFPDVSEMKRADEGRFVEVNQALVHKPWTIDELLQQVRRVLDANEFVI